MIALATPGPQSSVVPMHDASAARLPLDSGLRLLVAGTHLQHLRWSPDRHAPAARKLGTGELRLEILGFALGRPDVVCCRSQLRRSAVMHGRYGMNWHEVAVTGFGQVVESRHRALGVGELLRGPLHVGTHRVLRPLWLNAGSLEAVGDDPQQPARRYARVGRSELPGPPVAPARHDHVHEPLERAFAELRDAAHDSVRATWFSLRPDDSRPQWKWSIDASPCSPMPPPQQ